MNGSQRLGRVTLWFRRLGKTRCDGSEPGTLLVNEIGDGGLSVVDNMLWISEVTSSASLYVDLVIVNESSWFQCQAI